MGNFITAAHRGKSLMRQSLVNIKREQLCDALPTSYGWEYLRQHERHNLPVYHLNGVELMRHPTAPAWLVQYMGECYRSECYISQISAELETIKIKIEMELAKRDFNAAVELRAA